MNIPSRLERRIARADGGCWIWKGPWTTGGYGCCWFEGGTKRAHRVFYELEHGPILAGMTIDHTCGLRACVNPAHLDQVTMAENLKRASRAPSTINAAKTHCPRGHEYSEANTGTYKQKGITIRRCLKCHSLAESSRRHATRKDGGLSQS